MCTVCAVERLLLIHDGLVISLPYLHGSYKINIIDVLSPL